MDMLKGKGDMPAGWILLAHCYQPGFIQDMADIVGDSFMLAKTAAERPEMNVILAGVGFMAETAAILCPDKKVFLVSEMSGCPMADMITPEQLIRFQEEHPGAQTLCYVNSTAEVKALSDWCCTSSTAVTVAERMEPGRPILFVPDRHLGEYAAERSGREIICWNGFCNVHAILTAEDVLQGREAHPGATVMVHPECRKEVRHMADHVEGTGGMLRLARESTGTAFLIGTEIGFIHTLRKAGPSNDYIPLSPGLVCPNMKMSTLEDIDQVLKGSRAPVRVPAETAGKARRALERMLL